MCNFEFLAHSMRATYFVCPILGFGQDLNQCTMRTTGFKFVCNANILSARSVVYLRDAHLNCCLMLFLEHVAKHVWTIRFATFI